MNASLAARWFRNPHFSPAAVIARVGVNAGTVIWGVIVLSREHALDGSRFGAYASMLRLMPEDAWAAIAVALGGTGAFRLLSKATPHWLSTIGYVAMMLFWNYFALSLLVDYAYPLPPASAAGIVVIAGLSCYAVASRPKPADAVHV